jgi:hypothetical protein
MTDAARRARRQNLSKTLLPSERETRVIKLLIWQSCFEGGPSQRTFARQLGVYSSYVCKVQKQSSRALDAFASGARATLDDLEEARRFTAKLREQEPAPLAPAQSSHSEKPRAMNTDQAIAEMWRIARQSSGRIHAGVGVASSSLFGFAGRAGVPGKPIKANEVAMTDGRILLWR